MSTRHSSSFEPFIKIPKPDKPYPGFPPFPHANGCWAKKVRGKLHYFGPWGDPDGALKKHLEEKDALHTGRRPRPDPEALTVKDVANAFLNHKRDKMDAGELSVRTWVKYKEVTDLLIARLGKSRVVADLRPDDFTALKNHMTKRWGRCASPEDAPERWVESRPPFTW